MIQPVVAPSEPAAQTASFGLGGLNVSVTAPAASLAWLDYFLRPWFDTTTGERHARVEVLIDAAEFSRLRAAEGATMAVNAQDAPAGFLLDSRLVRLPVIRGDDERTWLRDPDLPVAYGVGAKGDVKIVAASDGSGLRTALMRVVRELAMIDSQARGSVLLHCAVAGFLRGAVAFCGPKRSGKTSLLLHQLLSGQADLVANDRAIARQSGIEIELHGLPTILAIRGDTVDRSSALAGRLRPLRDSFWLTPPEAEDMAAPGWTAAGTPIDLAPRRLADTLGVSIQPRSVLAALVFPHVDESLSGQVVKLIDAHAARRLLDTALVGADLPDRRADALWPDRGDFEAGRASLALLDRMASIPAFELALGLGAYDRQGLPAEIAEIVC